MKTSRRGGGIVFVGLSGGVDSSVAALLLQRQGHDVVGVFLRCWGGSDGPSTALGINCAERDAEDARRVAETLGIPLYVWDFETEYKQRVVEYMVEGYRMGITPNPDIACNREIKFGLFLERALTMGASHIATGHYVRRVLRDGIYRLYAAKDKNKDQSYFLWTLREQDVAHSLFPIGSYLKPEVRKIARAAGLPTAEKKDSQGICFLGKVTIEDFLRSYIPARPGIVVNTRQEAIGEHEGAHLYTIGQRHGIGNLKHRKGMTTHIPLYVAGKDVAANIVTVAEGSGNAALFTRDVRIAHINWMSRKPAASREVYARIRYRQPLGKATLTQDEDSCKLIFHSPQKFVAPGQSAVLYEKSGEMLGGGIIT